MYSLNSRLVFRSWPNPILAGAPYTHFEVLRDFFHQINSGKIRPSTSRPLRSTYRAIFYLFERSAPTGRSARVTSFAEYREV